MATFQMFWSIAATTCAIVFTALFVPIRPWTDWADVHSDRLRIDLLPAVFIPPKMARAYYISWWMVPLSTFLFVGFFAFGKDTTDEYKKSFRFGVSLLRLRLFHQTAS